jgi:hypothetical protein
MKNNINIGMADTLMGIFGYKRVSPTDDELKEMFDNETNEQENDDEKERDVKKD